MTTPIPPTLITLLRQAAHVVVSTGAGISAESGVPTFREAQTGLWERYNPTELASPQAFNRSPKLVWDWYAWRRELVANATPNPGHIALARLAHHVPRLTLITQNVDSLHQRAGSQNVLELHGNISRIRCHHCQRIAPTWDPDQHPPRCPSCDHFLRPDVVWFGENLPRNPLNQAFEAAANCDLFFTIGTSAQVQPAASLPIEALNNGAIVVEINPAETPLTPLATIVLRGPSGQILPALLTAAWPESSPS